MEECVCHQVDLKRAVIIVFTITLSYKKKKKNQKKNQKSNTNTILNIFNHLNQINFQFIKQINQQEENEHFKRKNS